MNLRFDREKQNRLRLAKDISKKGSIDEPIVDLVTLINENHNYYTTSSCSGRIIIVSKNEDNAKKGTKWLYVSHISAKTDDIMSAINTAIDESNDNNTFDATFKFEPFILHVCCNGLSAAKLLLSTAVGCGYRNSGISISKSERIMCAIRSCHSLEVPVISERKLIVSHHYIEHITHIANTKLKHNLDAINKFQLSLNDNIIKQCNI